MIVYKHTRLDTNEIFYIGIGKRNTRLTSTKNRNKFWHNIVNKAGYIAEVLFEFDTWLECCTKEIELIKQYGRRDLGLGPLVNLTDGGEGSLGLIGNIGHTGKLHSQATKDRISSTKQGSIPPNKGIPMSQQQKIKVSKSKMGQGSKLILCLETGIFYQGTKEASKALNININTLRGFLCGLKKNKTNLVYV